MSSGGQQRRSRQQRQGKKSGPPARQQDGLPASGNAHRTAKGAQSRDGALQMFEAYQGLLPHPDHLARFNEISPGAAETIINEFVAQGAHRRTLESRVVDGNERRSSIGQPLGFLLLLTAIIAGTLIAVTTDAKIGASVIGATIAGGAIIYVVGGRPPKNQ